MGEDRDLDSDDVVKYRDWKWSQSENASNRNQETQGRKGSNSHRNNKTQMSEHLFMNIETSILSKEIMHKLTCIEVIHL